jgi:hypothetical protein
MLATRAIARSPIRQAVLAIALVGWVGSMGSAQQVSDVLRVSRNVPGDSKPIILHADEISTWVEGTHRLILLKGLVLVEHGVLQARMHNGLIWIDLARTKATGVQRVALYAEGQVSVEQGGDLKKAETALIELNTRGELKLRSQDGKVIQQPRMNDAVVQRALALQPAGLVELAATKAGATQAAKPVQPSAHPIHSGTLPASGSGTPISGAPSALPPGSGVVPAHGTSLETGGSPNIVPMQGTAPSQPMVPPPGAQPWARPGAHPGAGSVPPVLVAPAQPPQVAVPQPGGGPPVLVPPPSWPSTTPPAPPSASPAPPPPHPVPPPDQQQGSRIPPPPPPPGQQSGAFPLSGPSGPPRQLRIAPRTSTGFQVTSQQLPEGESAYIVNGGVILTVGGEDGHTILDIEADRLVVWTRGDLQQMFGNMRSPEGHTSRELEFYLSGNVEIREQNLQAGRSPPPTGVGAVGSPGIVTPSPGRGTTKELVETRILRADEVYYDVARNVALAYQADLQMYQAGLVEPIHLQADELQQLGPNRFKALHAQVFSSRLPSDPGLKIYVSDAQLDMNRVPRRSIFGRIVVDRNTGQPIQETERIFTGRNVFFELEDVPFFYLPYVKADADDPLGPLKRISAKGDRVFGGQILTTFDLYELLGMDKAPGTRWYLEADYLSRRGPALGTEFSYSGNELFDTPGRYVGLVNAYGIRDVAQDILGGGRGALVEHPLYRGWFLARHQHELPYDFTLQTQASVLSDKNFLEQYYKDIFDRDINQETFVYLKQQRDNWAWTAIAEPRIRRWVNETEWLPRADGYLLGQSFFDLFTYNAHPSVAYARLKTTDQPPPPFGLTTFDSNAGRFDFWQDLSLPFSLGFVRLAPYAVLDLTYYTNDLNGDEAGRVYGGGGLRASIPFTRLYPDVESDWFNVNGLKHKIVLGCNYFNARSNVSFTRLAQFDRLNDDATDQAVRDIMPLEPLYNPVYGPSLATSTLFDPQVFAIRKLVDTRIDTLDDIEVLQADLRQRLQTKRGYPGMQHVVDWMTLDVSASWFPNSARDNFGSPFAFVQYDYVWNVGDRTALVSTGWFDPIDVVGAARVYTLGVFLNRPDRTNFYVGYRGIETLQSRAVTVASSYIFSPKYAMTLSSTYDFGINESMSNTLVFTRMGKDLQVSLGVNYNAIINNFGVVFEVVPNVAARNMRGMGLGSAMMGRGVGSRGF